MCAGIGRTAEGYFNTWLPYAQQMQVTLCAPKFDRNQFPTEAEYQLGNVMQHQSSKENQMPPAKKQKTATDAEDDDEQSDEPVQQPAGLKVNQVQDWSLNLIEQLFVYLKQHYGVTASSYMLYGHSAGSQFVHRFMLLMPQQHASLAIAANAGEHRKQRACSRTNPTPGVHSHEQAPERSDLSHRASALREADAFLAQGRCVEAQWCSKEGQCVLDPQARPASNSQCRQPDCHRLHPPKSCTTLYLYSDNCASDNSNSSSLRLCKLVAFLTFQLTLLHSPCLDVPPLRHGMHIVQAGTQCLMPASSGLTA